MGVVLSGAVLRKYEGETSADESIQKIPMHQIRHILIFLVSMFIGLRSFKGFYSLIGL